MIGLNGHNNVLKDHNGGSNSEVFIDNPLRPNAFSISDEGKIEQLTAKYGEIIDILGLDRNDDSLKDTPKRIAKMYINEIFSGLNPKNEPTIKLFRNNYKYDSPLVELNIPFISFCEHHFLPITGIANLAYIPKDYVIGLSKLHRLVKYYARRPQLQERLTQQVFSGLSKVLRTDDIGIAIKANHGCISCRGVDDQGSRTITSCFGGALKNDTSLQALLLT